MSVDDFTQKKFDWIGRVAADEGLPSPAHRVAIAILQHLNRKHRSCWPTQETIAAELCVAVRVVGKAIAALRDRGHLSVTRRGKHLPAVYTPDLENKSRLAAFPISRSAQTCRSDSARPAQTCRSENSDQHVSASRPASFGRQIGTNVPIEPIEEPIEKPIERIDSLQPRFDFEEDGRREVSPRQQPEDVDEAFEVFWQAYPKKVDKAKALVDYRRVIRGKKATAEELLKGANQYAAERFGQDPKFTKHPTTWLKAESWNNEPAPTGDGGYRPPSGQPDHIAVAEEFARQAMTKNGGGQNVH